MKTDDLITLLARDNPGVIVDDRTAPMRSLATVAAASLAVLVVFLTLAGPRAGLATGAIFAVVGLKLAVTLAAVAAGIVLARQLSRPVGSSATLLWLLSAAVLSGFGLWETAMLGTSGWQARMTGTNALYCLTMIPLISLLPLAGLLVALKARAPASPALAGAAAGLAAAGIGASVYALHCTEDSALFLAMWYSLAAGIVVALGALAGRRLLAW